jgi:hypothetical protein
MSECRVQLRRDRLETAWGFRLQGGQDFNSPLVVQRVFSGSPADGQLQRGDVLVSINNQDVSRLQQKQAEEFIKTAGTNLSLVVKRSAGGLQMNNVHQYACEPSQPTHQAFDDTPTRHRPQPPTSFANTSDTSAGYFQPKKHGQPNVWSPGSGAGTANYPPSQAQQSAPSYQSVNFQRPAAATAAGGYGGPQFVTNAGELDHGHHEVQSVGPAASWRDSQSTGARQPVQRYQEQPSQVPLQHENTNQGYAAAARSYSDENRTTPAQSGYPAGQQEDEDTYEPKSVREIKAMFNKPAKPPVVGQRSAANKPRPTWHDAKAPTVSHNQHSWNTAPAPTGKPKLVSTTRAFSPPSQPVQQRPSVLSPQDYSGAGWPPLSPPQPVQPIVGLLKPKQVSTPPKPGAGSSYQGIVTTVVPAKPVHYQGGKSSGSGGTKKKEFDPSQSLVYQMLQEESERAKRGEVAPEVDTAVKQQQPARRQPPPQQQQQHRQPQQSGSRLQDLLERDRASAQQDEPPHPSNAQQQQQQQQQQVQYQQQRMPQSAAGASHQAGASWQQSQQGRYQSYQNDPQPAAGYYQQPAGSSGNYYQQQDYYQPGYDGLPISDF